MLDKVAQRCGDRYLRAGIYFLADMWGDVADHLMTPEPVRKPIETLHDANRDIVDACGALCLAARFSGQAVTIGWNDYPLTATPETLPRDLSNEYTNHMRALHQASVNRFTSV